MGGMSVWHLLILLTIVLLIFGPSRLGDLGKSLGEAVRGFKKGLNDDPEIDVTASSRRETLRSSENHQQGAKEAMGQETATKTQSGEKDKA